MNKKQAKTLAKIAKKEAKQNLVEAPNQKLLTEPKEKWHKTPHVMAAFVSAIATIAAVFIAYWLSVR